MANKSNSATGLFSLSKYLGLALAIAGVPVSYIDPSSGSEIPLLAGLFILFISRNRTDDERSIQIKTTSLYFAFIIAYATKLVTTNLHEHSLISFELIHINHFLILTLATASIIYYFRLYVLKY